MSSSLSLRRLVVSASLLTLSACSGSSTPTEGAPPDPRNRVVAPACADPAPLLGSFDPRTPGYIVVLVDGTNFEASVTALAARHGFRVERVYATIHGFFAHLEPETVAALRCEPQVSYLEHDQVVRAF